MVYINEKYPSQQKSEVKKGVAEALSLVSQILMILQIVCLIITIVNVDSNFANHSMESLKYLMNNFLVLILLQFLSFISIFVLCFFSKKIKSNLIAPTYIRVLNGVYFVVAVILLLVFLF